uniref:NEDD4-binding protein 2-like isoform X2 n=1 Tax=Pristiophorus japonicus TaxID=55135 RepID=UPI00398F59B0
MMPAVEVNTGSLGPSDGGTGIPSSKRQKTEDTATQGDSDSSQLPEKEKSNAAEKQNGADVPTPCSNLNSQSESKGNESPTVCTFKEDNGQHNEKNSITVPGNKPEIEYELSLFYKELETMENETDLHVNECVDGSQGSAESKENAAMDNHRGNKTGKGCKKIAGMKHRAREVGDPCIDASQIHATEHPCAAHWNNVASPSRPQWNQPQAFIGPLRPPLPKFNIPLAYQRYSAQGPMPFPHEGRLLSNSYSSDCNIPPFTAKHESCIVQAGPINDCMIQPGHKYFYNYGPHQTTKGQPITLKPGQTNLYQQAPQLSRLGVGDKVLIFMRGPPGSGKSTLSRLLLAQSPNGVVLSTDDYFCQNGVYWFDPNFLGEAHEWNQKRAKQSMDEGRTPIIIDNTNIQAWEMKPYAEMAVERCYRVSFREPETWWKFNVVELEKRNKHRVPREKILQMMERFEHPMSSDIVLSSVEPLRTNTVLLNLQPHYSQREGKVRKKPKVLPSLNKRTRGNTKHKKKHRQHRNVKADQNQKSEIKTEFHWPGASLEQRTSECEDDLSNEEHSDAENISVTDLVTTQRDSQNNIGAQVEKILNCKIFEDKDEAFSIEENMFISIYKPVDTGNFKMADGLSVESCDLHINLPEDYEDSSDIENSLPLSEIHWELDQSHSSLVKNYISVIDTTAVKAKLVVLAQKYCIYISKKAIAGAVQYPSEIERVFKETPLEYVEGQEKVKTLVLEDEVDDYKRKEEASLILNRNFLTNLLEGKNIASWEYCDWLVDSICEQRQKRDCRFRHRDASVKNRAEKWLHKETAQQNPFCHESSSTENISQGNDCVLQLCPRGASSTAQCVANQFASTNILSETADGMKETNSFCPGKWVHESGKETTFRLQDSFYNPSLVNYRRKPKRFYKLAPTFQFSLETPVDSEEKRRKELVLTEIKPTNCMSTTNIFQSEMTSVNLSVQKNIGTCQEKLEQIAVEGSQFVNRFCETIHLSKIINNKVKKEGSKEDSLSKLGFDGSSNVQSLLILKHEMMCNDVLPDPSHVVEVYTINPSVNMLDKSKAFLTGKPVSICLPYANISRSSETLFSYADSIKKEDTLSSFNEQYSASLCNPCVGCELAEKSRQDDEQELLMFPEQCPFLELQLPLEFALQLVELFGSPGIDPDFLLAEDCKVRLDKQITHMIHSQWKKSVEERLKQISLMARNTFKGGMRLYNIQDINGEFYQEPNHETEEKSSAMLDSHPDRNLSGNDDLKLTGDDSA